MRQKPLDLAHEIVQGRGRAHVDRRGDEAAVQHDLAVGLHLDDAGDGDDQPVGEVIDRQREGQAQLRHADGRGLAVAAHGIHHLHLGGLVAAGGLFGAGQVHLDRAGAAGRDGQVDHAVLHRFRHFQRDRVILHLRHAEDRAVGGDPRTGADREFADLEQFVVDLERRTAPDIGRDPPREPGDERLGIAVGLLEMMRLKEQAFGPQNLAFPGQTLFSPFSFAGRAGENDFDRDRPT